MQIRPSTSSNGVVPSGVDYWSAFEMSGVNATSMSAEQWARAIFEGAPTAVRRGLYESWRAVMRLDLGPEEASTHVLGWFIAAVTPESITLTAESRFLTADNIVSVAADSVTWTTAVRYTGRPGKMIWALAKPIHRSTIRLLMKRAGRAAR